MPHRGKLKIIIIKAKFYDRFGKQTKKSFNYLIVCVFLRAQIVKPRKTWGALFPKAGLFSTYAKGSSVSAMP